jgi:hypothetical protein
MECLLDASFLGKLLVLPANVILDWKEIARYKHSSLFDLIISDKGKFFITLPPGVNVIKHVSLQLALWQNKLERLFMVILGE